VTTATPVAKRLITDLKLLRSSASSATQASYHAGERTRGA
jgi:hypothetical protein